MDEHFGPYQQIKTALELYEENVLAKASQGQRIDVINLGNAVGLLEFNALKVVTLNTSGLGFYGSMVQLEKQAREKPYNDEKVNAAIKEVERRRPIIELSLEAKLVA